MALARRSPIGEPAGPPGFTVVELLVVLAVMGLVLAAIPTVFSAMGSRTDAAAFAGALAADLRRARNTAIMTNREAGLRLVSADGRYTVVSGQRRREIPPDVRLQFSPLRGSANGRTDRVRFFPDGSSTGGEIRVSSGKYVHSIAVDWISGRVHVDD